MSNNLLKDVLFGLHALLLVLGQLKYIVEKKHKEIVHSNPSAGSVHSKGPPSVLNDIEEDILFWFFKLRKRGMKISVRMVMLKACELAPELRLKTTQAKDKILCGFRKSHDIVHQVVTHKSQRSPHEVQEQALQSWMEMIPPMVSALNPNKGCHIMSTVVDKIADLGVEVQHIPGGCTGLCQPIDVGVGMPFQWKVSHKWEEFMLEFRIDNAVLRPPTQSQLSKWIIDSATSRAFM